PAGDDRRTALLGRLGMALTWALDFDAAIATAIEAASEMDACDQDGTGYLVEVASDMWDAGFPRGAWTLAAQGLRNAGDRHDYRWATLMALDIIRRDAEAPHPSGAVVERPERDAVATFFVRRSGRQPWPPGLRVPLYLYLFGFDFPNDRADALDRFREELAIQMLAAGEYPRAAAGFEDMAARSTREGRISDAALGWSGVARCLNALGALAQARAACDRATALAARLAGPSMSSINIMGAMYEFAIADDGGWERLVSLAQAPPPEHQWAAVATMAAGARMCARLGRADDAMMLLESFLGPMEQAPDG